MIFLKPQMEWIDLEHLPEADSPRKKAETGLAFAEVENEKLSDAVERFEAHVIKETLEKHQYNRTKTAKALGLSIRNPYYQMDKYPLAKDSMQ